MISKEKKLHHQSNKQRLTKTGHIIATLYKYTPFILFHFNLNLIFTEVPVELTSPELEDTKAEIIPKTQESIDSPVAEEVIEDVLKPLTEPMQAEQKQEKKPKKPKKKDTIFPQIENVPKETQHSLEEPNDEKLSPTGVTTVEEIKKIVEDTPLEEKPKKMHKHKKPKEKEVVIPQESDDIIVEEPKDSIELIEEEKQKQQKPKKSKKNEDIPLQVTEHEKVEPAEEPKENKETVTKKIKKPPQDKDDVPTKQTLPDEIPESVTTKKSKLIPMKIERVTVKVNEAQHPEEVEGPQFTKLKLKKPAQKPKQEQTSVTLPKFQLKSRIRYINDWPPQEIKPIISFLGSVRQNGELSRNIKEAKIKKKPVIVPIIPDLEKVELEKPEEFDFSPHKAEISDYSEEKPLKDVEIVTEVPQPEKYKEIPQKETTSEETPKKTKKEMKKLVEQHVDDSPVKKSIPKLEEEPVLNLAQLREVPSEPIIKEEEEISTVSGDKPVDESLVVQQQPKKTKKKLKPVKDELTLVDTTNEDLGTHEKSKPDETKEIVELPENVSETIEEILEIPSETVEADTKEQIVKDTKTTESLVGEKPKKVKKVKKKDIPQKIKQNDIPTPEHPEDMATEPEEPVCKPEENDEVPEEKPKKTKKATEPEIAITTVEEQKIEMPRKDSVPTPKEQKEPKLKLIPIKIERKILEIGQPQHAESVEGPQFTKLKLKKTTTKPKPEAKAVTLPAFQLKSRIRYIDDWPPQIIKPIINFLGSVRQNGILSRNVKEAAKIKKKVYKEPQLPDIEKTELEKPTFGYEDIIEAKKQISEDQELDNDVKDEEPEQVTLKPRRPSVKKTEEVEEEVTIKKTLKPRRKPSVTLPEVTEPETVTFRPKSTKTKEDVEQEFNIHLDSYAEEEISLTSKVKLKPQRQPTFTEEADEASIKFYEEEEGPDVVEVIESDIEIEDDTANVMMSLKKPKKVKKLYKEDITSSVTIAKPKPAVDETSEITEDVNLKLERKPKYEVNDQEEVSFDIKPQSEQFTTEELSLSSKIKLKSKKRPTISEAADEASIKLTQEIEDDSQVEEVILSEAESEENIEMFIRRKPKKPAYEVSEIEELSVELKPKKINEDTYEEEQLTISAKRKPRKPSQVQGKRDCNFMAANLVLGAVI